MGLLEKIFGTHSQNELKRIYPIADRIEAMDEEMQKLTDDELREKCQSLKDLIQSRIAEDEARVAAIKEELEKEIPLSQKEALATESDKLVKKVDEIYAAKEKEIMTV